MDRAGRQLAHSADAFRVACVTDQQDMPAALVMNFGFPMNLRDERAGGVDGKQATLLCICRNGARNAMGGKDNRRAGFRNLVEFLDENGALCLQHFNDVAIMDDFMADIDRRAVGLDGSFDRVDRPNHAGAEAAWGAEDDAKGRLGSSWAKSVL